MKKYIVGILITVGAFLLNLELVSAGSLGITASSTSPIIGNNVIITVKAPGLAGNFSVTSSNPTVLSGGSNATWIDDETVTFTFKTNAVGTATVTVTPKDVADYSTGAAFTSSKSVTVTVRSKPVVVLSSNNKLSSIIIEGATLSPEFNADTLEYAVEFPPETTKISIGATASDSSATIAGLGEREVTDGNNRIELNVTAENGNVRTYVINATVKEYNPISVKVGEKDYTVVRKKGDLQPPNQFQETTVTINNEEVPAFYNEITKITLVGLKDETGAIAYFRYENDTYTPYQELSFNRIILMEETPDSSLIPKGFVTKKMKLGNQEVTVYYHEKLEKTLLYGMNVETGKSHFYVYEEQENTLQIFNEAELTAMSSDFDFKLILVLGSTTVLFFGSTIVFLVLFSRAKKGVNGKKESKKKEEGEEPKLREEKTKKKEKHRKKKSVLFDEEES